MFKQLKRLFGGRPEPGKSDRASAVLAVPRTGFKPATMCVPASQTRRAVPKPADKPSQQKSEINDEDVSLCLQSVLDALPPELKAKLVPMNVRGATLTVALHKVLPQLSSGAVRLSFGEIRRAAPMLFSMGEESDQQDIQLPLHELLAKINPFLLPPTQAPEPAPNRDAMESSFNRSADLPAEAEITDPFPIPEIVAAEPVPEPMRMPLPEKSPEALPVASPTPAPPRAVTTPNPSATSPAEEAPITVPLASLVAAWPMPVLAEIAQLNCASAQVTLPVELVQAGMKQGKVAFPWKAIRSWISPAPVSAISKNDNAELNLPLEVLMPLFLTRLKQTPQAQPRIVVDDDIPALFGPTASPDSPVIISDTAMNGVMMRADATSQTPKLPGTDFRNRYISPTDVVLRATDLKGVAGALVVLPEGLLVSGKVSTDQDSDALAAFLARAFGRVNQCAKESQVGELSHLEFSANGIPWHIFRLQGIFFAAFGLVGGTLPISQLTALANELDRTKRG